MIPSIVASELQEAIRRFLYASFPMTTPGFRREDGGTMLDDLLAEPEAIFKGPYLGLGLPFRRMESGAKLPFERIELSFTPYRHQFRAFQRLCGPNPRSTLVATGTGSGKTECFSLPILDYCAGRPEQGVKAIIVYPMNALLLRQPENLMSLLRAAFDVVSRCECREDETRDGCYRCLLAYRESRRMDEISRQAAEEILGKILAAADTLQPIEGLASVDINALLESELEQRFVDALANAPGVTLSPQLVHGKSGFFMSVAPQGAGQRAAAWKMEPQVQVGPGQGVAIHAKPDFVLWPVREAPGLLPVAIFMDGFQYHWNKVDDDTLKRQALLDSGRFRVWSLSWHTLPMPGMKQVNPAAHLFKTGQQATMQRLFTRLAPSGGWDPYLAYGGFIDQGPFRWLLAYLSGDSESLDRLRFAALSRALGWLDSRSVQDPAFRNAVLEDVRARFPEAVHADWSGTQQDPRILGGLLPATGGDAQMEGIDVGVCLPRSAMQAAAGGDLQGLQADIRLHLAMDDEHARQDKDFETRWGAFWGAANLLQFLPRLTFASARGIQKGLYGAVFQTAEQVWEEPEADEGDASQWQEIAQSSLFGESVFRLRDAGVPPPEVGIELVDEVGVVLPEIELLWREQRLAVVADVDESGRASLERLGWTLSAGLDDGVVADLARRLAP